MITQLVVASNMMPYVSEDKYFCHEEMLGEDIEMISGKVFTEERGRVWVCGYTCELLNDTLWRAISPLLISKQQIPCLILPDTGDSLIPVSMKCSAITYPTFAYDCHGHALWHNISFALREVTPHD